MDAVTYPNDAVMSSIQENVIPLRILSDSQPFSSNFNIKWTPTLIILDANGKEHYRSTGFVSPKEFIPLLLLGITKAYFDQEQLGKALEVSTNIVKKYPKSDTAPEAIYLQGVCRYKTTHDPAPLKEAYEKLKAKYPSSEWTKRAYPYRLLK